MPAARREAAGAPRVNAETFRFFRDLHRNNRKEWMDLHRQRYQSAVVQPLRGLLEELTPALYKLHPGFDCAGRTGVNFSRINRDIRFAKDKTPYRPQMYLKIPLQGGKAPGELYLGFHRDAVTAGFRVYFDRDTKALALAERLPEAASFCARQKRRLARQYESYWYSMEKGEWTKHQGWPVKAEEWKRLKAWIVRREFSTRTAVRPNFSKDVAAVFRQVLPLFRFVSQP